jgi:hypothetical protein
MQSRQLQVNDMGEQYRAYQSRLSVSPEEDMVLARYGCLFGKAERTLFAKLRGGENLAALKREFLPKFGITARQLNGMAAELAGKIASIRERQAGLIKDAEHE